MSLLYALAWIIAAIALLVGIFALVAPRQMAAGYGLPVNDDAGAGYCRGLGARDVAIGVAIATAAYYHDLVLMVVLAGGGIAVSIADFFIAYYHHPHKRLRPVHGIHAAGIVAFGLVLAMALFAIGK